MQAQYGLSGHFLLSYSLSAVYIIKESMQQIISKSGDSRPRFHLAVRIGGVAPGKGSDMSTSGGAARSAEKNARALAADILSARLVEASLVEGSSHIHAYWSGDSGQLLAASRALQLAFANFHSPASSPEPESSVAVVLGMAPPLNEGDELTDSIAEGNSILDLVHPWQILMTRTFLDHLTCGQLLQIKPASAVAGIYEFVWTGEDRLVRLQAHTRAQHILISMPAPDGEPSAASLGPSPLPVSMPRFQVLKTTAAYAATKFAAAYACARTWLGGQLSRRRRWANVSLGAAVLLASTTYVVTRHHHATNAVLPAVHSQQSALIKPEAVAQANTKAPPAVEVPVGHKAQSHPAASLTAAPSEKPKGHNCLIGDQISTYLAMAESNRTRGHYEDALRQYNKVLDCEPANHEARSGLERMRESGALHSPKE